MLSAALSASADFFTITGPGARHTRISANRAYRCSPIAGFGKCNQADQEQADGDRGGERFDLVAIICFQALASAERALNPYQPQQVIRASMPAPKQTSETLIERGSFCIFELV